LKILEYYTTFSNQELQKLTLFLESAYFNTDASLLDIHLWLIKHKSEEEIDVEKLHKFVFPQKQFLLNFIRVKLTRLSYLIQKFIEVEYSTTPFHLPIASHLNLRMNRNYESLVKQEFKNKDIDFKDPFYFLSKSLVHDFHNKYLLSDLGNNIEPYIQNIEIFNYNFDAFFILNKLRTLCNITNDQKILNHQFQFEFSDELKALIYNEKFDEIVLIKIYKLLYRVLQNEEEFYEEYVQMIKSNHTLIDYQEVISLLTLANNFCIKKINETKSAYFDKMFELIKYRIENDLILVDGMIQDRFFKNIVNTAIRVGEKDWAYNFIKKYIQYIPPSEYDKVYNFNMAFYMFEIQKYDKTIELLNKVEYDDLFYGFNVRVLMVKSYYELSELEPLESLIKSFKTFIQRKKGSSEAYKKSHVHFLDIVNSICKTSPRDKVKLKIISDKINTIKPMAEAAWLKGKTEKLI
jgi:hypothetical protein